MSDKVVPLTGRQFKVGDTVRLKSIPGPKMLIHDLRGTTKAVCIWFDEECIKEFTFSLDVLTYA
jgi:uncharacterized protein YodC (DUF2158 family)